MGNHVHIPMSGTYDHFHWKEQLAVIDCFEKSLFDLCIASIFAYFIHFIPNIL